MNHFNIKSIWVTNNWAVREVEITERDTRIALLEQQLAEARRQQNLAVASLVPAAPNSGSNLMDLTCRPSPREYKSKGKSLMIKIWMPLICLRAIIHLQHRHQMFVLGLLVPHKDTSAPPARGCKSNGCKGNYLGHPQGICWTIIT